MTRISVSQLRNKTKEELLKELSQLKNELQQLRIAKLTGGAQNKLCRLRTVRKSIAKVLTVYNQNIKNNLRKLYKGDKHKPLDIRPKKTRAIRKALKKSEKNAKTKKEIKKQTHFKIRKFAVKA